MVNPLLITKLYLPSPPSPGQLPLVQRKRLLEKLNQGLTNKLILISAAAGFGKTTLLSEWAHELKLPVSWLSLDERDNDLTRFWTYVVTALQQRHPNIGEATLAMLQFVSRSSEGSTEPTSAEAFLTPLINELAQLQTDVVLVLDDYHLINTSAIHDALIFLLEHLPLQVHLAIATRIDPPLSIARLRVRAQLTELHANDLRFTHEEAAAFLHQSLAQPLTEAQIATLQTQTEGWIAGLQLAMLSLREAADSEALIELFSGSQRNVLDYLVEEVLERQSQLVRKFLLRTSILEQMCQSLCKGNYSGLKHHNDLRQSTEVEVEFGETDAD
ncbi:AAA family ATPase [Phormidesmis sp. 146-33]